MRSQLCCALYALVARRLMEGASAADALAQAEAWLRSRFENTACDAELHRVLDARHTRGNGSGYVLDSLWSALQSLLDTNDVESCLRRAIALGNDTDTTAAIAGGLAGLLYGFEGTPARWVAALRGSDIADALLASLHREP
ncbi:ADP-ribosylglycohydrolase [Candidatus Burkholderia verschuerenii]|uniref:ADP-ribosylglycohydrolase n=1 Tax=Candidatus Burkholderia verschuerenii TaxID=242163 RepID=A0A0L0MDX9_9BURK|nr:ADP-ribosylglycohydrolase family protein [Candidatus Burkholderia verschuerenii]KND60501.1 ADP-ribosylglycohydrolase [Candidatus Burkholderia verschuerenii]